MDSDTSLYCKPRHSKFFIIFSQLTLPAQIPQSFPCAPHGLYLSLNQDCLSYVVYNILLPRPGISFSTPGLQPFCIYGCFEVQLEYQLLNKSPRTGWLFSTHSAHPLLPHVTTVHIGLQMFLYACVGPRRCCRHLNGRDFDVRKKTQALE